MATASQIANWQFRFGTHERLESVEDVKTWCRTWGKHWVFQVERSDTGYVHIQGQISLIKKRRKQELMPQFERTEPHIVPNFFEPTANASIRGGTDEFYAAKADTRIQGPWTDKDVEMFIPYHMEGIVLRPWQQYIADSAKPEFRNPRTIDLIYDPIGCNGKSTVADYIEIFHGGIDMPPMNDGQRLEETMCDKLRGRDLRDPKIVTFDMPKAMSKTQLHGLYTAIERIKRGKCEDTRNYGKEWRFHPPRVWIFTNSIPDTSMLSMDRWQFWRIGQDLHLHRTTIKEMVAWRDALAEQAEAGSSADS